MAVPIGAIAVAVAAIGFAAAPASAGHDKHKSRHHHGKHAQQCDRRGHHGGHGHHARHGYQHRHGHAHFVYRRHVAPACRYVPGHYETRTRRVLVSHGHYDRVWHEPRFGFRYDSCGNHVRFVISPGYHGKVWRPAQYRTECYRVHVPGRWVCADGCSGHHRH